MEATPISFTKVQSDSPNEPIIQKTMPWRSSAFDTAMMSMISEEEMKLIITPESKRPCISSMPRLMLRE